MYPSIQEVESQVRFPGVTSNPFFNFSPFCVDLNTSKMELWRREGWKMSALSASGLLARWWVFPTWVSETFHAQFPVSVTADTEASSRAREKTLWYPRLLFVVCTLDFLKSFYFCPGWLCHFKGLFTPVGREIHRSKIATVTSWQLTNRRLRVSAWRNLRTSRNTSVFAFFPRKSTTCFKSIPVKQVDRRDFVARFVATSLKLASRNYERSTCSKFICTYGCNTNINRSTRQGN